MKYVVSQLNWIDKHLGTYHLYDRPDSKSSGSHEVLKADVEQLLYDVDWDDEQQVIDTDAMQVQLNTIMEATRDMHVTVMEANVKIFIIDPIVEWATRPNN